MGKVAIILFVLLSLVGAAHARYTSFNWDAPAPDPTKPEPEYYELYCQDIATQEIKFYRTHGLFILMENMDLIANTSYKLWVKSCVGLLLKSERSNEIYYDSRMPAPPKNGRLER